MQLSWGQNQPWSGSHGDAQAMEPTGGLSYRYFYEDWADGLDVWTENVTGSFVTDAVYDGNESWYYQSSSPPTAEPVLEATLPGGPYQPDVLEFHYRETSSNSYGSGVRFTNSNGDHILGAATDNPQWNLWDANGFYADFESSQYQTWHRVTFFFDWPNDEYAWAWDDLGSSTYQEGTGRPLRNGGGDLNGIEVWDYAFDSWGQGGLMEIWFDGIAVGHTGGYL